MPSYTFINKDTEEEITIVLSLSEREIYLKDHPEMKQKITPIRTISGSLNINKVPSDVRDKLNGIKGYYKNSTIETF